MTNLRQRGDQQRYTTALDRLSQARSAAWAAYNAAPNDPALLDAAVAAQRAYDAWWRDYCRARPLPMNGTDSHEFGEC